MKNNKKIRTKQFQILSDQDAIWKFMTEVYERTWKNGVPAPFYEYALTSSWMNTSYTYLNRIWYDDDRIVGFVFYENPVTNIFFNLRSGYEELADEMIQYANESMPNFSNNRELVLFGGQDALMNAAQKYGYTKSYEYSDLLFDFNKELSCELPKGFSFVDKKEYDPLKLAICCWKGFNHEEDKGPFQNWNAEDPGTPWNPQKAMKGIMSASLSPAPHSTNQYDVIIQNEQGDYVCYSGMWFVKENNLAYMEPLCTVPEYRNIGLAKAALSKHYYDLKEMGATHMTGGDNPFYQKIGYDQEIKWTFWVIKEQK